MNLHTSRNIGECWSSPPWRLGLLNGRVPASSGPQTSTLASCSGGTPSRGGLRQMIPGNSGAICT
jgi:hypothetical protein